MAHGSSGNPGYTMPAWFMMSCVNTQIQCLDIFWDMMVESRWRWAAIYAYVVDHYGPQKFGGDKLTSCAPKPLSYYRKLYRQRTLQG